MTSFSSLLSAIAAVFLHLASCFLMRFYAALRVQVRRSMERELRRTQERLASEGCRGLRLDVGTKERLRKHESLLKKKLKLDAPPPEASPLLSASLDHYLTCIVRAPLGSYASHAAASAVCRLWLRHRGDLDLHCKVSRHLDHHSALPTVAFLPFASQFLSRLGARGEEEDDSTLYSGAGRPGSSQAGRSAPLHAFSSLLEMLVKDLCSQPGSDAVLFELLALHAFPSASLQREAAGRILALLRKTMTKRVEAAAAVVEACRKLTEKADGRGGVGGLHGLEGRGGGGVSGFDDAGLMSLLGRRVDLSLLEQPLSEGEESLSHFDPIVHLVASKSAAVVQQ
ncbi:MAG: hypothetical protein SGPRY_000351, partial [Prymnesium sp.]